MSLLLRLLPLFAVAAPLPAAPPTPVQLANPLVGSDSTVEFSHGNTYPAVALPFGMNAWSAYTQPWKDRFYYNYRANKIRGIRQTHQPSPWMGDYATFALMPVADALAVTEEARASVFAHEREVSMPSYYRVRLDTWKTVAEVTPTERGAVFRFTYEQAKAAYVVLEAFGGKALGKVELHPQQRKITGIARNVRGTPPADFGSHFVIVFDRPFSAHGTWQGEQTNAGATQLEAAEPMGAFVKFDVEPGTMITARVASSYISLEQAERNLAAEIGSADFETVRLRAEARWNEMLGRVQIEGGSLDQQRMFYTALYRSLLFPQKFHEPDAAGKAHYYSPYDGKVRPGFMYTNSGYWDTFRAVHPLLNLLYPEVSAEILPSLLAAYDESGWLPAWSSPGHRDIMVGNHAFSLLTDGWVKGVRTFDPKKALAAMVHDATTQSPPKLSAVGRDGAKEYFSLGYVPYERAKADEAEKTKSTPPPAVSVREATAKTLEFAYNDFCLAEFARVTGQKEEAARFAKSAMNYRNLFDPKVGFMRARRADGKWDEPFAADEWGGGFTEGNSWHWTWSVMHDVPGLIELLGGAKATGEKLDAVFSTAPTYGVGTYKQVIHEMIEMAASNLGQYAHGNQPVQHMIYLYNYVGQPWKTQSRVRQVMSLLYQPTPDGFCGDEDTGQMSAWYVFSALGFYPVCPGEVNYSVGSPLFDRATLKLPNGKTLTITARENGPQRPYVRSAELNGQKFERPFVAHEELLGGGEWTFSMTSTPESKWGTSPSARPPAAMAALLTAKQ